MLDGWIYQPKKRAGQFFKAERQIVIKERLTSYGSQALVRIGNKFIIVYWDCSDKRTIFTDCHQNIRIAHKLWREIVW